MTIAVVGTGRTGRLITDALLAQGADVVVVGRDEGRCGAVAADYADAVNSGTMRVCVAVDWAEALTGVRVVVNAASPFADTVKPLFAASASVGAHYLDVSNHYDTAAWVLAQDAAARAAGIAASPAVGFGTTVTDALAALVVAEAPDVIGLHVAMDPGVDGRSAGAAASARGLLARGGARLVAGELESFALGRHAWSVESVAGGRLTAVPVRLADLATIPETTGIATVQAGIALPVPRRLAPFALPVARFTIRDAAPRGGEGHCGSAWATALLAGGATLGATLTAGEGYALSAEITAAAAVLLERGAEPGATTAVRRWGPGIVTERVGVRVTVDTAAHV